MTNVDAEPVRKKEWTGSNRSICLGVRFKEKQGRCLWVKKKEEERFVAVGKQIERGC